MPREKIYECCICHDILKDEKPIRIVKQKYGNKGYNQYGNVCHYDFCKVCYSKINRWIKTHERVREQ